jgi:4-hydroxyphenylacetate 3-monooxygenase
MSQHDTTSATELTLTLAGSDHQVAFAPARLVIAGLTGRDAAAVQHHVDELREMGISVPEKVPAFWEVPVSLLSTSGHIEVDSRESSGEIEPVLFCTADGWYVGVGSDHTARDVERESIHKSKAACQKPLGDQVIPADTVMNSWGDLRIRSRAEGAPYQDAAMEEMILTLADILDAYREQFGEPETGLVMFLGTVPTVAGLNFGTTFEGEITGSGVNLACAYRVTVA